ncbi:signal peptidase I [Breznakia sp. PF5-3]|nr:MULTISPECIES: signal peptidase I [unclassified Breznakia]MDF9836122.1 signal peptidase I [Breznakia sp. PF5-3]MDF9838389.1 signal peptidase I [Breznakia sp. PFB2-8]
MIKVLIIFLILIFVITRFIFHQVEIYGDSMYPTLKAGEYGVSNKLFSNIKDIKRFEIVIIKDTNNRKGEDIELVKRVVGLPGETIFYMNDKLYVDGIEVEEPFLDAQYKQNYLKTSSVFTKDFGPVSLKEDEYFVLGDNRPYSSDSRSFGAIKAKNIISRGIIILYPFNSFGNGK